MEESVKINTYLVFNDPHGPWEDPRALQLVLDIAKDQGVTHIVINGDLLDFYNCNSHGPKSPHIQAILEDELQWGIDFFSDLRKKFPTEKIVYLYGNHEDRLERMIIRDCPSFWNLLTLDKQLQLKKHNIEWYRYNYEYAVEDTILRIQHSPPSYSKNLAMTCLEKKLDISAIYGCSHRIDHAVRTGGSGRIYEVWANGWLGSFSLSPEHNEVFRYAKGHQSWQQCFSLLTVIDGKEFVNKQIRILPGYKAVVNGYVYQG